MRVTALPAAGERTSNPFELALAGAADGHHIALSVLIHHTDKLGTRLFISGGHVGPSARIRAQLAPSCDVTTATPALIPRQWVGHGVRYRLQAEVGRVKDSSHDRRTGLLDRVTTISGDWALVVAFDHVKQLEVRDAQRSAVSTEPDRRPEPLNDASGIQQSVCDHSLRRLGPGPGVDRNDPRPARARRRGRLLGSRGVGIRE